jgi:membrane associated rhomboid family serine protease
MTAPNSHATLEKWIWILIYGGLFLVILGIATGRTEEGLGWSMAVPGAIIAVVGVVLIYVRSRLKDSKELP